MSFLAPLIPSATAATAVAAESAGLMAAAGATGGASVAATSALTTAAAGATGVGLLAGGGGLFGGLFGGQTGLGGLQAVGQLMSAFGRAEAYDGKAAVERIQGRQRALQQRQQGVEALRRLNENLATVFARGAAGNVDALSGSVLSLQNASARDAISEYYINKDNATIEMATANMQADQYEAAGDISMTTGLFEAAGTIGTGIYRDQQLGMPALSVAA